jgi:hypothetical protein
MIMPVTEEKPPRFEQDDMPKDIFRGDTQLGIVAHIRRSERELAAFLYEWYGRDLSERRVDGDPFQ